MRGDELALHPAEAMKVMELLLAQTARPDVRDGQLLDIRDLTDEQLGALVRRTIWGGDRRMFLNTITVRRLV